MANSQKTGDKTTNQRVQSVETLFSIVEYMKENQGTGITEVAEKINLSKGAVHRYMQTLVSLGYVVNEGGEYDVGLQFLDFGSYARQRVSHHEYIESKVEYLAEKTGERAQFIVPEHGKGIYIFRKSGDNAVKTDARIGKIVWLHTTAAGKAILSQFDESKIMSIVDMYGLEEQTLNTIATKDELFDELEQIRECGYAVNFNEHVDGLCAAGVPIKGVSGKVIGGLSVSGPTNRLFDRIENGPIQQELLGVANEIELQIEYT